MIYLELFLTFFKIGIVSFGGGYAMLALMRDEIMARGWLNDAYPSATFRDILRKRNVRFVLNSDSHAADTLDCAFERFADAEDFVAEFIK